MVDFEEELEEAGTIDDIKSLKLWMFKEQIRIQAQSDELNELKRTLQKEKRSLEQDRKALDVKIKNAQKRFDDNEIFIAKKQKIIEDAFRQLALDKKELECERLNLEYEKDRFARARLNARKGFDGASFESSSYGGCVFFRGVDNELALRKRYKELLKIFHPDNKCGDTKTLLLIQKEYENIKKSYYEV